MSENSSTQKPESYLHMKFDPEENLGIRFAKAYLDEGHDPMDPLVSPTYGGTLPLSPQKKAELTFPIKI